MAVIPETRSRVPLVLWLATAIFIVYGTTIPFQFVPDSSIAAAHFRNFTAGVVRTFQVGQHVSGPDFVSNVWLFTPFGCFGMWAFRRPRSRIMRALLLTILGGALSAGVETLQLFTLDRVSSFSDIIANTAGAAIGAVAGIALRTTTATMMNTGATSGLIQSPAFYPLLAAAALLCAGAWEPFNATLDVGSVVPKIRNFVHDPLQRGPLSDEGVSLMQHLLFTAALYAWLKEIRARYAAATAALVGALAAVALEGSQFIIESRRPGVWDAAIGVAGSLLGVPVGIAYVKRSYSPLWPLALVGGTLVAAAIQQMSPFTAVVGEPRTFQWMPFLNYYQFTTAQTVSHSAELLLTYLPMGFGLALAAYSGSFRWLLPLGAALAIAAPLEFMQRYIGGRYPDVTDVAMSVAGAGIGAWLATTGWRLFAADMKIISSHPRTGTTVSRPRVAHRA